MDNEARRHGRPTRERAAAIADHVLGVARTIFCEQGIAGASMDDIAAASGVTKHTIYRRYPSKLSLVNAVVERDLCELTSAIQAVVRDSDPVTALRETASRYFHFSMEPTNACFSRFLLAEAAYSAEMRGNLARWHELFLAPMIAHVEAAQREGRIAPGDPRHWCLLLVDLLGQASRLRHTDDNVLDGVQPQTFFAQRWRIFVQAVGIADG